MRRRKRLTLLRLLSRHISCTGCLIVCSVTKRVSAWEALYRQQPVILKKKDILSVTRNNIYLNALHFWPHLFSNEDDVALLKKLLVAGSFWGRSTGAAEVKSRYIYKTMVIISNLYFNNAYCYVIIVVNFRKANCHIYSLDFIVMYIMVLLWYKIRSSWPGHVRTSTSIILASLFFNLIKIRSCCTCKLFGLKRQKNQSLQMGTNNFIFWFYLTYSKIVLPTVYLINKPNNSYVENIYVFPSEQSETERR